MACLLLGASGCGSFYTPQMAGPLPAVGDTWVAPDPAALAAWGNFPAGAHPRPIVISAPPRVPDAGFDTSDAKLAAIARHYRLAARLPPGPASTVRVTLPDGPAELPTLTARQAVEALSTGTTGPSLPITRVELGTATFSSDRGPLPLPAWLFTVDGARGPIAWPAIAPSAFWLRDPAVEVRFAGARASADGRTVTVSLPAARPVCAGEWRYRYEPAVLESASAVVVGLRAVLDGIEPGDPAPGCATDLPLHLADYAMPLASPLGGRVLLAPAGVDYTQVLAVGPA